MKLLLDLAFEAGLVFALALVVVATVSKFRPRRARWSRTRRRQLR